MNHRVEHGPSFAWLKVGLAEGEQIQAEAGAMVSRDPQVEMSTHLNAGQGAGFWRVFVAFLVALARKFLGDTIACSSAYTENNRHFAHCEWL